MKILVDGTPLVRTHTGVAQYEINLLRELAKIDRTNQYYIYVMKVTNFDKLPVEAPNFHYRYIRFPIKFYSLLHRVLRLPVPVDWLARVKPDLAIFANFVRYPLASHAKSIITVHDLTYLKYPQYCPERNRKFLTRFVPPSLKNAAAIVAVSAHTKHDLVDCYQVDPNRITEIPNAVDLNKYKPTASTKLLEHLDLKPGYILFVSTLEPRKNVVGIIEAYLNLPADLKHQHPLVLAGGRGWKDEEIQAKIAAAQTAGEQLITPGFILDQDLPALYSGASLFVFPSFYEGFGIPPLEAMACGVPVVTSNTSSLPEVVGDAAITVDPADTQALTHAMKQVLTDQTLAKSLKQAGLKQVKKFSWPASAKKLLQLIESLS